MNVVNNSKNWNEILWFWSYWLTAMWNEVVAFNHLQCFKLLFSFLNLKIENQLLIFISSLEIYSMELSRVYNNRTTTFILYTLNIRTVMLSHQNWKNKIKQNNVQQQRHLILKKLNNIFAFLSYLRLWRDCPIRMLRSSRQVLNRCFNVFRTSEFKKQ